MKKIKPLRYLTDTPACSPTLSTASTGLLRWGWLALCLLLFCWGARAQPLAPQTLSRDLGPEVSYLEDASGQLSVSDVMRPQMQRHFKGWNANQGPINLGFTQSAYWLRVELQRAPQAPTQWVLEIPFFQLHTIDFYAPGAVPITTGSAHPLSSRPYLHRYFAFPVQLDTEAKTYYLRITNEHSMTVPLTLWQEKAFRNQVQSTFIVQSLYFGGLLSLLVYNLFIFFSLRDLRFLLYAIFASTFGLGMLAGNGFGQMFLWPEQPAFDNHAQMLFLGLAAGFAMLFGDVFLQARQSMPLLSRCLRGTAAWFWTLVLLMTTTPWHPLSTELLVKCMMLTSIPAGILVTWASVGALRTGHKGVRFFLLAWSTLWLGSLIATLRAFGWVPTSTFTAYSLQISSAIEMLLLSLALADMINIERQQREAAQQEALRAQQNLLEHARTSEERLERAVQERTTQLKRALDNEMQLLKQYMRFGALISHEFRNPLGIIDSQISLMRKEQDKGQLQLDKRLSTISGATRRLLSLFEKWLQGDRLNHALQNMNAQPVNLMAWLSEIVDEQSTYHSTHRLQLLPGAGSGKAVADEDLLEIAVLNLIDNACKYSPPGSLVQIELRERPGQLGIAVTDQGPGIAPEHQTMILEDYYRISPEGPIRGMGLGLPFVVRIAQMHLGELEVHSQPGRGSTFCLWLPVPQKQ